MTVTEKDLGIPVLSLSRVPLERPGIEQDDGHLGLGVIGAGAQPDGAGVAAGVQFGEADHHLGDASYVRGRARHSGTSRGHLQACLFDGFGSGWSGARRAPIAPKIS